MKRSDLEAIIRDGDPETTVQVAQTLGGQLVQERLSTGQIRNIFGTVRRIEMSWGLDADDVTQRKAHRDLVLLKPKMAYQAKRERGRGVETLTRILTDAIDLVQGDRTRFQHFVDFFEAVLAYHKAAGGSN